jgi:hypothetical protein
MNDSKKFSIVVSIMIIVLVIDVSLSSATTVTSMASAWGIGVFTVTVVAYGIGQYFILEFLNRKSRVIKVNLAFFKVLSSTVTIIHSRNN